MLITPATLVADIASRHPRSMDFCRGGRRPLDKVCREKGVDAEALAADIDDDDAAETPSDRTWTDAPVGELPDCVVGRYHSALREDLPRLDKMADKVAEIFGSRHAELFEIAAVYRVLRADPHLADEEERGFPALRRLAAPGGTWTDKERTPLRRLEEQHDHSGATFARLRDLSSGFAVPEDGGKTYRAHYEAPPAYGASCANTSSSSPSPAS